MDERLRAVCDLMMPQAREMAGLHEYDGRVQDLSPSGIRAALSRLEEAGRSAGPLDDAHDEAHLAVFEQSVRVQYGDLELHRRDPYPHLSNLELACYDREYASRKERAAARRKHLAQWPEAIEASLESLDRVSAPVAEALLGTAYGLAVGLDAQQGRVEEEALRAHARLVARLEAAAQDGDPDPRLGGAALAALMGAQEGLRVDLGALADEAARERDRLTELLTGACAAYDPNRTVDELIPVLLADHPDADEVIAEAARLTDEVIDFTRDHGLAPYVDGECLVGPAPPSRRWSMAMMAWAAPAEKGSVPSWYHVTPPEPEWPRAEQEEWLTVFSRTSLPSITVHEVAPGHFAHGRALRRTRGPVRRVLHSLAFAEGWAHYVEEVCFEEGFRGRDPRFAIGVALEALVRVTRLTCAIGLHTGAMDLEEAARLFVRDAHLARTSALAEARRGTFDAGYGRYTWGKLEIMRLRERARRRWGREFSLPRFHRALLSLGSPPLGLLADALDLPAFR
ncbi:DUF885 family protein [Actinacidiphila acidipaludis]|uniref:DUF885 domain-containing protein n=1 Tax=Actinacidiphila acidipaludis TaxID=2873382 RepID=A0ABS7QEM8_9ACTN|nr:DUF885 family protein [Streptomyces acidipaludis]MBY8881623.1 DUF885 domain-containing protein [Streptomyces acidipaludis]